MSKLFPETVDEYVEEFRSSAKRARFATPTEIVDSYAMGCITAINRYETDLVRAHARMEVVIAARELVRQELRP